MTDAKHTPGPWRYFRQGDGTRFIITARKPEDPGNRFEDFAEVDIQHEPEARLIASAPELLEALRALLEVHGRRRHPLGAPNEGIAYDVAASVAKARAAILKAEGGQS